jgi:uncharacterized membrane protein
VCSAGSAHFGGPARIPRFIHHDITPILARCHFGTIVWNFIVLGAVSLILFGSGLIGTDEPDPLAIAIFSIILALSGLTLDSRSQVHDPADSGSI